MSFISWFSEHQNQTMGEVIQVVIYSNYCSILTMYEKHVVFIPCYKIGARDYDYMFVKHALFCVSIFRMYN